MAWYNDLWNWINKTVDKIVNINNQWQDKNNEIKEIQTGIQTGNKEDLNNLAGELKEISQEETGNVILDQIGDWAGEQAEKIENKTNNNNQNMINENQQEEYNVAGWQTWAEEQQKKQWEREDTIRRETQAREDTAYQRTVEDMRKAGINPNLMNISPAQAGGGITSATGINTGLTEEQMKEQLKLLEQMIDNEFKADENQKDRLLDILGKIVLFAGVKGFKK